MNLNRVTIAGRLSRDPEQRFTTSGKSVVNCAVAVNRQWKTESGEKRDEVTFIDVTMWTSVGEAFFKHHRKGSNVFIEGRLHLEQWDDKETGKKRAKLGVIGESWQFVGSKPDEQTGTQREPATRPARTITDESAATLSKNPPPPDDDVPF